MGQLPYGLKKNNNKNSLNLLSQALQPAHLNSCSQLISEGPFPNSFPNAPSRSPNDRPQRPAASPAHALQAGWPHPAPRPSLWRQLLRVHGGRAPWGARGEVCVTRGGSCAPSAGRAPQGRAGTYVACAACAACPRWGVRATRRVPPPGAARRGAEPGRARRRRGRHVEAQQGRGGALCRHLAGRCAFAEREIVERIPFC